MVDHIYVIIKLAMIVWVFGIIEAIGNYKFIPILFGLGIPIRKYSLSTSICDFDLHQNMLVEKEEGIFKFIDKSQLYFRGRLRKNPLSFRHVGTLKQNTLEVVTLIPISSVIFIILWLLAVLLVPFNSGFSLAGLLVICIFWGLAILLISYSFKSEKERHNLILLELEQLIQTLA